MLQQHCPAWPRLPVGSLTGSGDAQFQGEPSGGFRLSAILCFANAGWQNVHQASVQKKSFSSEVLFVSALKFCECFKIMVTLAQYSLLQLIPLQIKYFLLLVFYTHKIAPGSSSEGIKCQAGIFNVHFILVVHVSCLI